MAPRGYDKGYGLVKITIVIVGWFIFLAAVKFNKKVLLYYHLCYILLKPIECADFQSGALIQQTVVAMVVDADVESCFRLSTSTST